MLIDLINDYKTIYSRNNNDYLVVLCVLILLKDYS